MNPTTPWVILALPQDYAEIERTIQQLDVLPRQVLIDAQIYQVALTDDLSFGVTAALQARGTLANASNDCFVSAAAVTGRWGSCTEPHSHLPISEEPGNWSVF